MGIDVAWNKSKYDFWPHLFLMKLHASILQPINEIISTSCFKDFTPTLLQCYWRFTNFLIALINPIVHEIINELLVKKTHFQQINIFQYHFLFKRGLLFGNMFIFSKGVLLESELLNFLICRVKHGANDWWLALAS